MAKFAYDKQNQVINEFNRIIQNENRLKQRGQVELTQIEKSILESRNRPKPAKREVYISFYNPNNPLNGSSSWTKQQWAEYKETQKSLKTK
jgi:hypothetical protein